MPCNIYNPSLRASGDPWLQAQSDVFRRHALLACASSAAQALTYDT
jgi:hypothetical protein